MKYSIGNAYRVSDNVYIIAKASHPKYDKHVALVNVMSGNYWTDPVEVDSYFEFTSEELDRTLNGAKYLGKSLEDLL